MQPQNGVEQADQVDHGIYVAIFNLDRTRRLTVGRLGRFAFAPGLYFYVGSAQRNLGARLQRHARRKKPLRWHIDYLSRYAEMLGAVVIDAPAEAECRLARKFAKKFAAPVPRFGASDCRCAAHLFHCPDWARLG